MIPTKSTPKAGDSLRPRAEKLLAAQGPDREKIPMKGVQKLVHELQVHQIELEMQNETMRHAQVEAEESRTKYEDLFDFAPVGYFTFDQQGLMLEVNLTGAGLLGVERRSLINTPFVLFLAPESRPVFSAHLRQVFASPDRQTCKLQLATRAGDSLHVTLESRAADSRQNGLRECRSVMSDLEEIRQQRDELKELNQLITEQSEQILSVYRLVTELSKALNLDETVKTFVSFLQEHLNLEKHVLVLLDDEGVIQMVNVAGSLPNQAGILTSCLKNSEEFYAMLSSGLRMAKGEYSEAPDCLNQFFENWVIWPFKGKQRALGSSVKVTLAICGSSRWRPS